MTYTSYTAAELDAKFAALDDRVAALETGGVSDPLPAPTGVTATVDQAANGITVGWDAVAGATSYTVHGDKTFPLTTEQTSTTFDGLPAGSYEFWAVATDGSRVSGESAHVTATITTETAPSGYGITQPGPDTPPTGAVVVRVGDDLNDLTAANLGGTVFWLEPGVHTSSEVNLADEHSGNTYLGAPGAVLDGGGQGYRAFTGVYQANPTDITIKYLEVRNYKVGKSYAAINFTACADWTVEQCYLHHNGGAAVKAGPGVVLRHNLITDNEQYWVNSWMPPWQPGRLTNLLIEHNEAARNNTAGHSDGGSKIWDADGVTVRHNWVHHNYGKAIWFDFNNNDVLIEDNLVEDNDEDAVFYEISYNAIIRNNTFRRNLWAVGQQHVASGSTWPAGSIYISESGGDSRLPARTDRIEIYGNVLEDNWSGITCFENANRFVGPADSQDCTLVLRNAGGCAPCFDPQQRLTEPYYSDCRWRTMNVDIHHNEFRHNPDMIEGLGQVNHDAGHGGKMALFSNWGNYEPWTGNTIRDAVTFEQNNHWHDNTYVGPWRFEAHNQRYGYTWDEWRTAPYHQDPGSTLTQ